MMRTTLQKKPFSRYNLPFASSSEHPLCSKDRHQSLQTESKLAFITPKLWEKVPGPPVAAYAPSAKLAFGPAARCAGNAETRRHKSICICG